MTGELVQVAPSPDLSAAVLDTGRVPLWPCAGRAPRPGRVAAALRRPARARPSAATTRPPPAGASPTAASGWPDRCSRQPDRVRGLRVRVHRRRARRPRRGAGVIRAAASRQAGGGSGGRPAWRDHAACHGTSDPELFFPIAQTGPAYVEQVTRAKAVRARCPVRTACLRVDGARGAGPHGGHQPCAVRRGRGAGGCVRSARTPRARLTVAHDPASSSTTG